MTGFVHYAVIGAAVTAGVLALGLVFAAIRAFL